MRSRSGKRAVVDDEVIDDDDDDEHVGVGGLGVERESQREGERGAGYNSVLLQGSRTIQPRSTTVSLRALFTTVQCLPQYSTIIAVGSLPPRVLTMRTTGSSGKQEVDAVACLSLG